MHENKSEGYGYGSEANDRNDQDNLGAEEINIKNYDQEDKDDELNKDTVKIDRRINTDFTNNL